MTIAYELYRAVRGTKDRFINSEKSCFGPSAQKLSYLLETSEKFVLPDMSNKDPWITKEQLRNSRQIRLPYSVVTAEAKIDDSQSVLLLASDYPIIDAPFDFKKNIQFIAFAYDLLARDFILFPFIGSCQRQSDLGEVPKIYALPANDLVLDNETLQTWFVGAAGRTLFTIAAERHGFQTKYPYAQSKTSRRAMSKKRRIFAHRQLFFSPIPVQREKREPVGTHASPAMHKRRGHFRQLKSGKVVWVKSSIVGKPENGVVTKDYVMEGANQ